MSRSFPSIAAALAELTDRGRPRSVAYLFTDASPTVIKIRRDDESTHGRFIQIIKDDRRGRYVLGDDA